MEIFKKSVIKYLEKLGIENKAIKELKYTELKKYSLQKLSTIYDLLKDEKFEDIKKLLAFSPAGDGYGSDNNFISFEIPEYEKPIDISEIIDLLIKLKNE